MKLIIQSATKQNKLEVIENPKEDFIKKEFSEDDFTFAILMPVDKTTYIQAKKAEKTGLFVLRYQDGSPDRHYENEKQISSSRAISAFIWYLRGDPSWQTEFVWERIVV